MNPKHGPQGEIVRIDQGGLIFYGGLILASIALVVFARHQRVPVWHVADFAIPALAVRILTGLPAWSCVSAHGLETVSLPRGLGELVVAADNDPHHVGERAAHRLARRAQREGIPVVKVSVPKRTGADWLDVLVARSPA